MLSVTLIDADGHDIYVPTGPDNTAPFKGDSCAAVQQSLAVRGFDCLGTSWAQCATAARADPSLGSGERRSRGVGVWLVTAGIFSSAV